MLAEFLAGVIPVQCTPNKLLINPNKKVSI